MTDETTPREEWGPGSICFALVPPGHQANSETDNPWSPPDHIQGSLVRELDLRVTDARHA